MCFARMAAGMADWSVEPNGHREMQARLSNEQFEILSLAPLDFASRTAKTCLDLCAAAAFRLAGGVPPKGQESDVGALAKRVREDKIVLSPGQAQWLATAVGAAEWMKLARVPA